MLNDARSELAHFCAFHLVERIAFPSIDKKKQLPPLLAASCFPVPRKHSPPSLFSRFITRKHKTKQIHSSIVEAKPRPTLRYTWWDTASLCVAKCASASSFCTRTPKSSLNSTCCELCARCDLGVRACARNVRHASPVALAAKICEVGRRTSVPGRKQER